ncbi:DUF6326 family protein [Puniceicoccaceae bacterium K14]|nr:DUF6326 family protein [Puniceicoccaceae bacterium K14]
MNNYSLENHKVPQGISISLLWASLMGLYVYNDYFSLYRPGTIQNMMDGIMGPLGPATNGVFITVSMLLAIPAMMIFLSTALPPVFSRWLNLLLSILYTIVNALTLKGSPPFYQIVVGLEIITTVTIFIYALRWPEENQNASG